MEDKNILISQLFFGIVFLVLISLPLLSMGYILIINDVNKDFVLNALHEIASVVLSLTSLLLGLIIYSRYVKSKDRFSYYSSLGFIGFAIIYAMHGILTESNSVFFAICGPLSRMVMVSYILIAITGSNEKMKSLPQHKNRILLHILFFTLILVAAYFASLRIDTSEVKLQPDIIVVLLSAIAIIIMLYKDIYKSFTSKIYLAVLFILAISSLIFIFSKPWNAMWWLAHALFAASFFLIGYAYQCMSIFENPKSN